MSNHDDNPRDREEPRPSKQSEPLDKDLPSPEQLNEPAEPAQPTRGTRRDDQMTTTDTDPATRPGMTNDAELEQQDILILVLSFFLPGVGHMMLNQTKRGIAILAVSIVTCGGLGLLAFASVIDAYCVTLSQKYRSVGDWEFFPDFNRHLTGKGGGEIESH